MVSRTYTALPYKGYRNELSFFARRRFFRCGNAPLSVGGDFCLNGPKIAFLMGADFGKVSVFCCIRHPGAPVVFPVSEAFGEP